MAMAYATLIAHGWKTFEQVPKKLQPKVKELLNEMGLDELGTPLED